MKPRERAPICEPGDPLALEKCYAAAPEEWTEETLRAAVEMQRQEREGRLAAKARRRVRERGVTDDGGEESRESNGVVVGDCEDSSKLPRSSDAGEGPTKRKRAPRKAETAG